MEALRLQPSGKPPWCFSWYIMRKFIFLLHV
nr:MAG TPA_asm: hypothetical protein [Caudoviricetes sp.]